ncbi:MAG: hypothetical protein ABFD12_02300, partial [Syntrophorhabdus sp.]
THNNFFIHHPGLDPGSKVLTAMDSRSKDRGNDGESKSRLEFIEKLIVTQPRRRESKVLAVLSRTCK